MVTELNNRFHGIRLHRRGAGAMRHDLGVEEWWPGYVIDVRPIEKPAIAAEINLFVAGAEFHECELDAREQPLGNN